MTLPYLAAIIIIISDDQMYVFYSIVINYKFIHQPPDMCQQ